MAQSLDTAGAAGRSERRHASNPLTNIHRATAMPDLTIRIKKNADGSAALTCTRADGTVTWQRQVGIHGAFFPRHDLTHFAVESVLEVQDAFYGLIAAGWNISDFGPPWPRGPLPERAGVVELIVGFLDAERASGVYWPAVDFNDKAATYYLDHGIQTAPPTLTDETLGRIRRRRAELFAQWEAVAPGTAIELVFVAGANAHPDSTPNQSWGDTRRPARSR